MYIYRVKFSYTYYIKGVQWLGYTMKMFISETLIKLDMICHTKEIYKGELRFFFFKTNDFGIWNTNLINVQ